MYCYYFEKSFTNLQYLSLGLSSYHHQQQQLPPPPQSSNQAKREMSADAVKSIRVTGQLERDGVIYYTIVMQTFIRQWTVNRRYSQFDTLNARLMKRFPSRTLPAELPPKHFSLLPTFKKQDLSPVQMEERRQGLENYLRAILMAEDPRWRECDEWKAFLQYPLARNLSFSTIHSNNSGSTLASVKEEPAYNSATWTSKFHEQETLISNVRAISRKREAVMQRGAAIEAQKLVNEARPILNGIKETLKLLEKWLEENSKKELTDGERRRRADLVKGLNGDIKTLEKLFSTTITAQNNINNALLDPSQPARPLNAARNSPLQQQQHRWPDNLEFSPGSPQTRSDKSFQQFATSPSSSNRSSSPHNVPQLLRTNTRPQSSRVFGNTSSQTQETGETRKLDNQGLLQFQQVQLKRQDSQLEQLSKVLSKQKEMGWQIHDELKLQQEMLTELDENIDQVHTKLQQANKQITKIGK